MPKDSFFAPSLNIEQMNLMTEVVTYVPREQVFANIKHNVNLVVEKTNLKVPWFAKAMGLGGNGNLIRLVSGETVNSTHLIFNFAQLADVDFNTFVSKQLKELPATAGQKQHFIHSTEFIEKIYSF